MKGRSVAPGEEGRANWTVGLKRTIELVRELEMTENVTVDFEENGEHNGEKDCCGELSLSFL